MTKQEAKKLGNRIIDCFVKHFGDIRRSDITLCIQDDEAEDSKHLATVGQNLLYKTHTIRYYLNPEHTEKDMLPAICHELAHIATADYAIHYDNFVGDCDGDDEESVSFKAFRQAEERVAMRFVDMMVELWRLKKEGKK
jgi:hypothetical protein